MIISGIVCLVVGGIVLWKIRQTGESYPVVTVLMWIFLGIGVLLVAKGLVNS